MEQVYHCGKRGYPESSGKDKYLLTTEVSKFDGKFRANIINAEAGYASYCSQQSFETEEDAVAYALEVIKGRLPGFHY